MLAGRASGTEMAQHCLLFISDVIFGLPLFQHMLRTVSGNTGTQLKTTHTPTEVCLRTLDQTEEHSSTLGGSFCTFSLSASLQTDWSSELSALSRVHAELWEPGRADAAVISFSSARISLLIVHSKAWS